MDTYDFLEKLTKTPGISGFEHDIAALLSEKLSEFCSEVRIDRAKNVTGIIRSGKSSAKKIMLEAHLDRIGLIVSETDENGFVRFSALGGIDERTLPATEVLILGADTVYGVIGAKPPHLLSKTDSKTITLDDMLIDTGICGDELHKKIRIGDPILLLSPMCRLLGSRVSSPALDNRAGIAAIFECLSLVDKSSLPYDLYVAFTSGEESGLHGAHTVISDDVPDLAIIVDVTHGSTPDEHGYATFPLGSGPAICRGPNLHYEITKSIISLAEKLEIPHEIEVASGSSGTNAWAIQTKHGGIPCALISIPLRYMHTTVETVDLNDISNTAKLLAEIVCGGVELA